MKDHCSLESQPLMPSGHSSRGIKKEKVKVASFSSKAESPSPSLCFGRYAVNVRMYRTSLVNLFRALTDQHRSTSFCEMTQESELDVPRAVAVSTWPQTS